METVYVVGISKRELKDKHRKVYEALTNVPTGISKRELKDEVPNPDYLGLVLGLNLKKRIESVIEALDPHGLLENLKKRIESGG